MSGTLSSRRPGRPFRPFRPFRPLAPFRRSRGPLRARRVATLLAACAALAGCGLHGPGGVRATRAEYNVAIQETNQQELLLNLVRLRYRDTLYFMSVEKVASTLDFGRTLGASATLNEARPDSLTLGGASVSLVERPTVFYAPLDGERFARQMMNLVNPEALVLLANSGWSIERLLLVTLQEMNGLRNAPTAAGPTPATEPVYREFRDAARRLRSLQVRRLLDVGRIAVDERSYLELRFDPAAREDVDVVEFKRLLGLRADRDRFRVVPGLGRGDGEQLNVVPRSLIGVMNYLSQGVVPPARDVAAGVVTTTLGDDGRPFDWAQVLGGLFEVSSARTRPPRAAVALRYRDAWFYIRDDDLDSKSTFALLSQLLALQAGPLGGRETPISFSIG